MSDSFFIFDLIIAYGLVIALYLSMRAGRISRYVWALFWVGCLIGATWEFTFHFMGPEYTDQPIYQLLNEWPLPPLLLPVTHSLWDGGLFLIGMALVYQLTEAPHFTRWNWRQLGVMVGWGITSAVTIEIMGAVGGGWVYIPQPWNPQIFTINGSAITLAPILIWTVAPIVFYVVALALRLGDHLERRIGAL